MWESALFPGSIFMYSAKDSTNFQKNLRQNSAKKLTLPKHANIIDKYGNLREIGSVL